MNSQMGIWGISVALPPVAAIIIMYIGCTAAHGGLMAMSKRVRPTSAERRIGLQPLAGGHCAGEGGRALALHLGEEDREHHQRQEHHQ